MKRKKEDFARGGTWGRRGSFWTSAEFVWAHGIMLPVLVKICTRKVARINQNAVEFVNANSLSNSSSVGVSRAQYFRANNYFEKQIVTAILPQKLLTKILNWLCFNSDNMCIYVNYGCHSSVTVSMKRNRMFYSRGLSHSPLVSTTQ